MSKRPTIKCSLCDSYFVEGRQYREHWEKEHFYPYLKKDSFNYEKAKADGHK